MRTESFPTQPRAAGLLAMAVLLVSGPGLAASFDREEQALNERFAGKMATAKINIPIVRSLYVRPDGSFDERRYYERVKKFPTGLKAGESAKLQRIVVERDGIALCLHRQCGLPRMAVRRTTLFTSKRKTARVLIELGRPVTAADLEPDAVLRAIQRVLSIEGEQPPTDFSPDALLAGLAEPAGGATGAQESAGVAGGSLPAGAEGGSEGVELAAVDPELRVLSAEVDPPRASPGESIALVAHFAVSGSTLPITEERQILVEGRALLSQPRASTADWAPGNHTSRLELELPHTARPGIYVFRLTLRGGGLEQTKEALFEVR